MDVGQFDIALNNCTDVVRTYAEMERLNFEAQEANSAALEEDTYKYRFKPII